ncbi:RluA family pseudouridine synthase [Fundicoccus culcitae]|uniref:Pseudouridine synthase n=1 Tax=Fundicoccus culcitae TaxID=2969821 RepID=A0ABY5P6L2_9LACT|nr:RluA family pseudouridine synthase [Fundicoccus culcitae]UUX34184.1 RluA family pseudouridine synthase [Fundicoccus culcitae]
MEFIFNYQFKQSMLVKQYLQRLELPRSFISNIKQTGSILLNGQPVTVRKVINYGDELVLLQAPERGHDTVIPSFIPLDIVYEDRDILVINKAAQTVSIPSIQNPNTSVANRVKGYYLKQSYDDQVIHIVTRLDRDTTGLMLIAKHRLAHALLDRQIRDKQIAKYYYAISSKANWDKHGVINAPIARDSQSLITRKVDESGKEALTEFHLVQSFSDSALLKLQLHTGRTHQIRVHLAYSGGPLIGDDLYGGPLTEVLSRQALHCGELIFEQPFTKQTIHLTSSLPLDMQQWISTRNAENASKLT